VFGIRGTLCPGSMLALLYCFCALAIYLQMLMKMNWICLDG
jgi:hypothetical protein